MGWPQIIHIVTRISSANGLQDLQQLWTERAALGLGVQQLSIRSWCLGLDFSLFPRTADGALGGNMGLSSNGCLWLYLQCHIRNTCPCSVHKASYAACMQSSVIAHRFWCELKTISMTEIQFMVKEEAQDKVSILLFSIFYKGFHTHYKELQGYIYKERSKIKWSRA